MEVANRFRKATVFGLDLSPIHRNDAPANCHFVTGDLNQGLKFDSDSMDLVNSRLYAYILHLIVKMDQGGTHKRAMAKAHKGSVSGHQVWHRMGASSGNRSPHALRR